MWNLTGILLFAANIFFMLECMIAPSTLDAISLVVVLALDVIYKKIRPEWVKV
jgi:hypothetical protein